MAREYRDRRPKGVFLAHAVEGCCICIAKAIFVSRRRQREIKIMAPEWRVVSPQTTIESRLSCWPRVGTFSWPLTNEHTVLGSKWDPVARIRLATLPPCKNANVSAAAGIVMVPGLNVCVFIVSATFRRAWSRSASRRNPRG